jgi:hypothetical protein
MRTGSEDGEFSTRRHLWHRLRPMSVCRPPLPHAARSLALSLLIPACGAHPPASGPEKQAQALSAGTSPRASGGGTCPGSQFAGRGPGDAGGGGGDGGDAALGARAKADRQRTHTAGRGAAGDAARRRRGHPDADADPLREEQRGAPRRLVPLRPRQGGRVPRGRVGSELHGGRGCAQRADVPVGHRSQRGRPAPGLRGSDRGLRDARVTAGALRGGTRRRPAAGCSRPPSRGCRSRSGGGCFACTARRARPC